MNGTAKIFLNCNELKLVLVGDSMNRKNYAYFVQFLDSLGGKFKKVVVQINSNLYMFLEKGYMLKLLISFPNLVAED